MKPDAALGVGAIEDSEAVAIGYLDDLAGEGVGRGRYGEKYEEEKSDQTDCPMHSLIPGILDLRTSQLTL